MFQISTMLLNIDERSKQPKPTPEAIEAAKGQIEAQGSIVREIKKKDKKNKEAIMAEVSYRANLLVFVVLSNTILGCSFDREAEPPELSASYFYLNRSRCTGRKAHQSQS